MSLVSPDAPAAETLTLIQCLNQADVGAMMVDAAWSEAASATGIPAAAAQAGADGLRLAFNNALNIPLGEMVKAACLKLFAPMGAASGNEPLPLTLATMVVESSHHPTVTAGWSGISLVLRLTVDLSLEIAGAQLLAEAGRVVGLRTGTSAGKAKIGLMSRDAMVVLGTPEFRLPGELRFAKPAAISERR